MYLPHFLPAHLFFLFISHYARIAPSNRQNICIKIKHLKYKTKFEHLLTRKMNLPYGKMDERRCSIYTKNRNGGPLVRCLTLKKKTAAHVRSHG